MLKGERAIDFRWDNPSVASPPKDSPTRYQWQRVVEYTEFADWAALSRHFAPLYVKAATLTPNSAVKREASRIAAAHASSLERASAALKLVQQDVRYIYVGLNGANLTPAALKRRGSAAMAIARARQLCFWRCSPSSESKRNPCWSAPPVSTMASISACRCRTSSTTF